MKKDKKGFIFGLSGVITGAILSFFSYVIISLIAVALSLGNNSTESSILMILQYINYASILFALISICLNFKFPKISGILMILASILYAAVYIYLIILGALNANFILILIGLIPAILFAISAIFTFKQTK